MSATGLGVQREKAVRLAMRGLLKPVALSVAEAAKRTRLSESQVKKLLKARRVLTHKREGQIRIPISELPRLRGRVTAAMPESTRRKR